MCGSCNNCFCCGFYLVPRYKRLVNNIFPADPQHGLDKNNLERLRFYAVVKPEKLDRSFRYMSEKIARYLRSRNKPYVILGIKAMNDTMKSCYQQLNTFVDYYLGTLHLVLEETNDLELIEHTIQSFESFCEIREEAPNYQRNYGFFVDRFTQLCHYNEQANQQKYRCLGLRGHHAFIRKTANDELQNDVWKYMDQIVPSIIFNMSIRTETSSPKSPTTISTDEIVVIMDDPSQLAEIVLKDLFYRTHLNNLSVCIQPVLTHLDAHLKWIPDDFPKYVFSIIMNSIKSLNSYVVIDLLLNHLDKYFDKKSTGNIKTSIMNVIHDCLVFAATNTGASSTMFAGISSLLKFLKKSFELKINGDEQEFQTAVINGIGDFAEKLPDFQMMEILQHIIMSMPMRNEDQKIQLLLLQTIHKITQIKRSKHTNHSHSSRVTTTDLTGVEYEVTTYPHPLFDPLIKLMNSPEIEIRLIVLDILQLLIDKRHYANKFRKIRIPKDIEQFGLPNESTTTRPFDIAFMKRYGRQFLAQIYQCLLNPTNTKDLFYSIHCLVNLVTLETSDQDALVDIIHFYFEIQSAILDDNQKKLLRNNVYCIHALIAAYFNLISKLYKINGFAVHVDEIISNREHHAPYLLPPNAFRLSSKEDPARILPKDCLFSQDIVIHALKKANYDTTRFNRTIPNIEDLDLPGEKDYDEGDLEDSISSRTDSHITDDDQNEGLSFQEICRAVTTPESPSARSRDNRQLVNDFRTKPFQELKTLVHERRKQTDQRMEQLLHVRYLPQEDLPIVISNTSMNNSPPPMNSFNYPPLFTY